MINAKGVPKAPTSRTIVYKPERIEIEGNIVIDRMTYRSAVRPRKRSRPNAYAANDPTSSDRTEVMLDTKAEFLRLTKNRSPPRTYR
jgi:hypothetical protein